VTMDWRSYCSCNYNGHVPAFLPFENKVIDKI